MTQRTAQHNNWHIALQEWRINWRIGFAALLGAGLCFSVWPSVSSLFIAPLQEAFGWSRGQIALAQNASLLGAIASPLLGRLIDRIGVRPILLLGLLATALAYLGLASVQGSLAHYYFAYCVFSVVGVTTTGLTFTRVVTGAFVGSRGLALAITRSGLAVAGALLPSLIFYVIAVYGWRMGFLSMALLMILVVLPAVWLWVRGPSVMPLGVSSGNKPEGLLSLLKNHKIIFICLASALNYAPIVAILTQFQPLLMGKGIEATQAVALIGLVGVAAFVGALVTGILVDRFWAPLVACLFTLGPAVGCLLLMPEALSLGWAMIAIILLGLGQGAEIDVVAFMIARYFGMRSYAAIYGLSVLFIAVAFAIGGTLIGFAFDYFGNYEMALMVCAGCFVAAAMCYLAMGRYPNETIS